MTSVLNQAENILDFLVGKFSNLIWAPGSTFSVASLLSALCVAITFILLTRKKKRDVGIRVMIRALFPRRWYRSPSLRADFGMLLFNVGAGAIVFGWAVMSVDFITRNVQGGLTNAFGVIAQTGQSGFAGKLIATVSLFLAYELGYWVDHSLSHRIPLLWQFHKVHHTAEVLSPMTNYRVHPVDTVVFYNIEAIFLGVTAGVLNYLLGTGIGVFAIGGTNLILLGFVFMTVHLQHSHVWIATTGAWGRVILSPAHHQIHHSVDPAHFNKNFGSCLALWDWMFGTLHMPSREREPVSFGIEPRARRQHTAVAMLLEPFLRALEVALRPIIRIGRPAKGVDTIPAE